MEEYTYPTYKTFIPDVTSAEQNPLPEISPLDRQQTRFTTKNFADTLLSRAVFGVG
jgi:hypothetical protein